MYTKIKQDIKDMVLQLNPMFNGEEEIENTKEDLLELKNDLIEKLEYYEEAVAKTEDIIYELEQVENLVELYEADKDWKNSFTLVEFMLEYGNEKVENMVDEAIQGERENVCEPYGESSSYHYLSLNQVEACVYELKALIDIVEDCLY